VPPLEGIGFEDAVHVLVSMLEGIGFEGAVLGPVSSVLERAAAGRIMSCIKRRRPAIVKVHQRYSFTHKTAKIQERRKSR